MTYQLCFAGVDGMVLGSDQREFGQGISRKIRKIRIDQSGKFAWAYAGPDMIATLNRHLVRAFDERPPGSAEGAAKLLESCAGPALDEWRQMASGPTGGGDATIVLACGESKRIFRAIWRPTTEAEEILDGKYIAGQKANLASFIAERFYSSKMSVNEMSSLCAYGIRCAHDYDPLMVDGLDLAIYRDPVGRFEFTDSDSSWRTVEGIDQKIRSLFV